MATGQTVDGALVQWGERLFYPPNRIVRTHSPPRLDTLVRRKAGVIRGRIVATVRGHAPQVMVKVTGGGRGMAAIAAHLRYISKNGRLPMEDDREVVRSGKDALRDLAEQWRHGGALIPEEGQRREALNIMLSMPRGTDPLFVHRAAREFAAKELVGHRFVMVLHDHQANPHVHISVKVAGRDGSRLNPRKADLHRWRETFAEKLRGWGIEAEASRQATRGANRRFEPLWRVKAKDEGRLRTSRATLKSGEPYRMSRLGAAEAWTRIAMALQGSDRADDQALALDIKRFVGESAFLHELADAQRKPGQPERAVPTHQPRIVPQPTRNIEIER